MNRDELRQFLENVKNGDIDIDSAAEYLKDLPYTDMDYAKLDNHRGIRSGYPEVIYCEGKDREHLKGIVKKMIERDANILATRASEDIYNAILEVTDNVVYHKLARICVINSRQVEKK